MFGEHRYEVRSTWTGDSGTGTSGYRDYDRAVTIEVAGKPDLLASSDKPFRGDPTRWNPEDLLLAALSECHLLSYLHACVQAGVRVVGYTDDASGVMIEDGRGGGAFREVVLRPHVVGPGPPDLDRAGLQRRHRCGRRAAGHRLSRAGGAR